MTCAHVLGLIDAGDFADYPRQHLEAAWAHARQCARCGPALEMASRFTSGLAALPQPAPPRDLLSAVLAGIERIEHPQAFSVPSAATATPPASRARDWLASAAVLGSVAAALAIVLATVSGVDGLINARPRLVMSPEMPPATTNTAVLAAGLALYVAGLFAPLRGRS